MTPNLARYALCLLALGAAACGSEDATEGLDAAPDLAAVRDSIRADRAEASAAAASAAVVASLDTAGLASENVERESFSYGGGGRDPFVSLLDAEKMGPEFADLQLLAIYYDQHRPVRSVAVLRDRVSGKRYSMQAGDRAGRLSVMSIRERDVLFSIEDFGYERQETLSLPKREVELQ